MSRLLKSWIALAALVAVATSTQALAWPYVNRIIASPATHRWVYLSAGWHYLRAQNLSPGADPVLHVWGPGYSGPVYIGGGDSSFLLGNPFFLTGSSSQIDWNRDQAINSSEYVRAPIAWATWVGCDAMTTNYQSLLDGPFYGATPDLVKFNDRLYAFYAGSDERLHYRQGQVSPRDWRGSCPGGSTPGSVCMTWGPEQTVTTSAGVRSATALQFGSGMLVAIRTNFGSVRMLFSTAVDGGGNFTGWSADTYFGISTVQEPELSLMYVDAARFGVEGEKGTGKSEAARAVHASSRRRGGPLVVVDCGALEEACGGTVFLDEIGELPLSLQPKLLRALEERQIRRVGSNAHRRIDVRVIAATHRDLGAEVASGRFRADLYFRLAVVRVALPPLRQHPEDLPHPRPRPPSTRPCRTRAPAAAALDAFERAYAQALLASHGGKVTVAAEVAGLNRVYLHRLLRRHGLR